MSRRDIIIAAVLINTGLLAILFMMAIHNDPTSESIEVSETQLVDSKPVVSELNMETHAIVQPRDELDQVLKDYPLNIPSAFVQEVKEESLPQVIVDAPKPSKEIKKDYVEVTVKRGDYLEKIAKANGTTVDIIMKANKLSNERIDIGQMLKIPLHSKKIISENQSTKKNTLQQPEISHSNGQFYTLKSGDNPWKVAKEYRVKFDDLLKLNNLDEEKAKGLKPGDVLRVH